MFGAADSNGIYSYNVDLNQIYILTDFGGPGISDYW